SLASLQARATLTAASVTAPGPATVRDLDLALDATVEQLKTAPSVRLKLDGKAGSVSLPPVGGKALPPDSMTLALAGTRRADGTIEVDQLDLKSGLATVAGKGQVAADMGSGQGNVTVDVPSLAPFSLFAGVPLAGKSRLELGVRPAP